MLLEQLRVEDLSHDVGGHVEGTYELHVANPLVLELAHLPLSPLHVLSIRASGTPLDEVARRLAIGLHVDGAVRLVI